MKQTVFFFVFFATFCFAGQAQASNPIATQQTLMKECAAQYHQKKLPKAQYHAFMSECLKAHPGKMSVGPTK
jgi:hypothetical protein